MSRIRLALAAIPLLIGLIAVVPAEVAASHLGDGIPDPTAVSVSFVRSVQAQISDRISARLVAYDGQPISDAEIEFRQEIEFLGPRLVLLGRGVTDTTGVAQVPITATVDRLLIEVQFAGNERYAPSVTTVDVVVPPASVRSEAGFEPPRPGVGLGQLASLMPMAIAGATVGVWIVLVALVLVTLRRIRRSQPNDVSEMGGREGPP